MIIKICGMRDAENIRAVTELGIDWIGMIFQKESPRNVTMISTHAGIIPDKAEAFFSASSQSSADSSRHVPLRVGVFVDEMAQNIITNAVNFKLDLIQLHGNETPTLIRNLHRTFIPDIRPDIQFIKTITIPTDDRSACRDAIATYKQYEDCVDYFLFDTCCKTIDDSATPFDWSVLESYNGAKPFLLSGGIGPDDAKRIKAFHHPKCIGINLDSHFETEPGIKDIKALSQFLEEIQ